MSKPILSADVRPTATVIKRTGTFTLGHASAPGLGHVELDFEFRKSTELTSTFDNANKMLNGLTTGDYVKYEISYGGTQHVLFYGIIQRVEFVSTDMTVMLECLDASTVGKSRDLNRELYQEFKSNVPVSVDLSGTNTYSTPVPADTEFGAPVTVKSRRVEGNHLRHKYNTDAGIQYDTIYQAPLDPTATTGLGGNSTLAAKASCAAYEFGNGANKHVAQVFEVPFTTTLTNIILPLTIVRHIHENAANSGHADYCPIYAADGGAASWAMPGEVGNCQYCFQSTDDTTSATASPSMLGDTEWLEISLVRAQPVKDSGVGATNYTPADTAVQGGDYIPTMKNASTEWNGVSGHHWGTPEGSGYDEPYPETDNLYHLSGAEAIHNVSPTQPIAAPNGPVGETIKRTYKWRKMFDDNGLEAYTMYEWNFEHDPIKVSAGDKIAIILAMRGTVNIASLLPLDEIPTPNDDSVYQKHVTSCAYWGVGMSKYSSQTLYANYNKGSYVISAMSDSSNNLKGYHGEAVFSTLAHTPGYNGRYAAYGIWEYMANVNPQVGQMEAWNTSNAGISLDMFDFPLYDKRKNVTTMMFTVVLGGYRPLSPVQHYDLDELDRKIRYGVNAAIYTPIDTDYMSTNIIKLDYYANPVSGGLLNSSDKASVSSMVRKLSSFITSWDATLVDAVGDLVDDVAGVGYNDPATWPFYYMTAVQTNVWDAIGEVALRSDAQAWVHDTGAVTTMVFERLTTITDFTYDGPANHQYTYSSRKGDPNWMKHIIKMSISRDLDNMYSRFKVVGRTDPKTQYGYNAYTKEYMEVRTTEPSPLTYILDVPEIETLVGYRREKVLTNNRNINSYQTASDAAVALKALYGVDQWSGEITLAGLHPIHDSALGLIFDRNAVVRIIDENNPTLSSTSGTANVFRVTGATYNASQHTTKLRLTNLIEARPELQARQLLEDLRKSTALENTGRHISEFLSNGVSTVPYTSDITVALFDSAGVELTVPGYARVQASMVNNSELSTFQVMATFAAGIGTIPSQSAPIKKAKIYGNGGASISDFYTFEDEILKWDMDSLTITIDIPRS